MLFILSILHMNLFNSVILKLGMQLYLPASRLKEIPNFRKLKIRDELISIIEVV